MRRASSDVAFWRVLSYSSMYLTSGAAICCWLVCIRAVWCGLVLSGDPDLRRLLRLPYASSRPALAVLVPSEELASSAGVVPVEKTSTRRLTEEARSGVGRPSCVSGERSRWSLGLDWQTCRWMHFPCSDACPTSYSRLSRSRVKLNLFNAFYRGLAPLHYPIIHVFAYGVYR